MPPDSSRTWIPASSGDHAMKVILLLLSISICVSSTSLLLTIEMRVYLLPSPLANSHAKSYTAYRGPFNS